MASLFSKTLTLPFLSPRLTLTRHHNIRRYATELNPSRPMNNESTQRMFQLKFDPLTGTSEWVVVDENDDVSVVPTAVDLSTTSYLDMLNDSRRNKAYRLAIDKTITRPCHVLDIGAGTGLLSMMAARAMTLAESDGDKGRVTACESYLPMMKLMRKVLHCNGMGRKINIINKRSDELKVGADINSRADVLVSEILDSELLGEGLIPSLQNAYDELLVENPQTIPYRATTYGQLVESTFLWSLHDLYNNEAFVSDDIRLVPTEQDSSLCIRPQQYPMHCDPLREEMKLLSEPFKIFEFDFWKRPESCGEAELLIKANDSGKVNAVISWWVLQLDQEGKILYSTAPKWAREIWTEIPGGSNWCDHWKQCVWFVPGKGLSVSKGEDISLHAVHSDISVSYYLKVLRQSTESAHGSCYKKFHLILPPEKIATYSDDNWRQTVLLALRNALRKRDSYLCFVADDSVFLASAIAHLSKTSRILLSFPGLREKGLQYLQAVAEVNQFSLDCFELLDRRKDCMTKDTADEEKVDLLVGEPFYYGCDSQLPWKNLRFWKERTRLERMLSKDAHIFPCKGFLRVCPMFLPDLWRSHCSLGDIEGFDHSVVNVTLGACGNLPPPKEGPVLPFFVWQCGQIEELSGRFTLMEFDFSKPMSSCSGKGKVEFTKTGICHGFVLWIDWVLDAENGIVITTGPDNRHWRQGVKLLTKPVAVGAGDCNRPNESHMVEMEANFDSSSGDLLIEHAFLH